MDRDLDTERLADELAALTAADKSVSRRTFFRGAAGAAGTFAFLHASNTGTHSASKHGSNAGHDD